jgi:ribonuclease HII
MLEMTPPTLKEERRLWKKGRARVVGLDEVGRGPLAGPVVAVAFLIRSNFKMPRALRKELRDSKKLSAKKRLKFYRFFQVHPDMEWGIGRASEGVIDSINILQATKLAMKLALVQLEKKTGKADFLIVDGNFTIDSKLQQKAVPKGDEKVFSCAAASIMAKVTRDRMMVGYHRKYPKYGFDRHKGYGTRMHIKNLKKYGPCAIHRKSFFPVASLI